MVSFQRVAIPNTHFLMLLGVVTFLVQMELLHVLRYSKFISIMSVTLANSSSDLLSMFLCAVLIILAYGCSGSLLFGHSLREYSDIKQTVYTLTSAFLGKYNYMAIKTVGHTLGSVYLMSYLLVTVYLIMSVFITLLNYFLEAISNDKSKWPKDHLVFDHFISSVKSFVLDKTDDKEQVIDKNKT